MKVLSLSAIIGLLLAVAAVSSPINILEDTYYSGLGLDEGNAEEINFDQAWQGYLNAFNPIRDALLTRDFSGIRPWIQHLKDAAVKFSKAKAPERSEKVLRKLQKEVLKKTKAFLKVIKTKNHDDILTAFNHLKDEVDHLENFRINH